jgi:fructose-specific phosphotransferase system IIC component
MTLKMVTRMKIFASACATTMISGCSQAPTYDIMGSLFPAWLVCIVFGILLAVLSRWVLLRAQIAVLSPVLVYPCLAAAFTFAIWLVFFQ